MSRPPTPSETSLQSLLESARELPRQPEAVRARALARARTAAAAAATLSTATASAARPTWPRQLLAPAAAAALASGIVGSVFALGGYWSRGEPASATRTLPAPSVPAPAAPLVVAPSPAAAPSLVPAPVPAPETTPHVRGTRAAPNASARDAEQATYGAELELMRSAHVAYARHDFPSALLLVGEHARRFPGGLLTEEREALRVRSLLGAGRVTEARRAATSFGLRFPRSVLVHRLQAEVGAGGD